MASGDSRTENGHDEGQADTGAGGDADAERGLLGNAVSRHRQQGNALGHKVSLRPQSVYCCLQAEHHRTRGLRAECIA